MVDPKSKFRTIELKNWHLEEEPIGSGGVAEVHLCTSVRTGRQHACKVMRLEDKMDVDDFEAEVAILAKCGKHHNICHLIDHAMDVHYGFLIMPLCTGGEVAEHIINGLCNERDSAMAIADVLTALTFLHDKGIVHRDVKPENCLFRDKAAGAPVKLVDFGLAIELEPNERASDVCGTMSYIAPEVLRENYGHACDAWSVGVMAHVMLCGSVPFPGRTEEEKEASILKGFRGFAQSASAAAIATISDTAKDFVSRLLTAEPERLSVRQALLHPWISDRAKLSTAPRPAEVIQSLKKYAGAHHFERAVRHALATHLTSTELHRLRNAFEAIDTEGTGAIHIGSLRDALEAGGGGMGGFERGTAGADGAATDQLHEQVHVIDDILQSVLQQLDVDNDGFVDWRDFVAAGDGACRMGLVGACGMAQLVLTIFLSPLPDQ